VPGLPGRACRPPTSEGRASPSALHLVVAPGVLGDRLPAELLRERDANGLVLAIGVVGADRDPQAVGLREKNELDFAARSGPRHLDRICVVMREAATR